ncbi:MAG: 30S ribosome-binding factor RbfA [Nitrolancea sp.]
MSSRRQQQVAEFLREEISEIMLRELKDPRLGLVSITHVDVSPDLRHARAFVSVLGTDDEFAAAVTALNGAAGFVRHVLKPRMHTRHIPEISFVADYSMRRAEQMTKTLNEIRHSDEVAEHSAQGEDEEKRD